MVAVANDTERPWSERFAVADGLSDSDGRRSLLGRLAAEFFDQDEQDWSEVSDHRLRQELVLHLRSEEVGSGWDDRLAELQSITDPHLRSEWIAITASAGLEYLPHAELVYWLESQDGFVLEEEAAFVNSLARRWLNADPAEASAWIGSLPQGRAKDEAIVTLVSEMKVWEPESALAWAIQVADPRLRETLAKEVYEPWVAIEPTRAEAALREAARLNSSEDTP